MKLNFIIGVLCCVFSANKLQADQLEWITKEQAIAAVEYLQQQEAVIIWCGCCEEDRMRPVVITKVYYEKVENEGEDYYTVKIDGFDGEGNEIVGEPLDLAYVHIVKDYVAYCLGVELGFECDPCVEPFPLE